MNQHTTQAEGILSLAKEVLKIESAAVSALSDRIGDDFVRAVQALLACRGRVVARLRPQWLPPGPPLSLFMPPKHRMVTLA